MNFTSFQTDRLIIRPTHTDDAGFLFELMNSPKWIEHIGDRKIYSLREARNYIRHTMYPQLEKFGFSNNTLILKSNGMKAGVCGIYYREKEMRFDLGYALLPQFAGYGYAFEAAQAVMQSVIKNHGIHRFSAITSTHNFSSQKVLGKLGFRFSRVIRSDDGRQELMLYEWTRQKADSEPEDHAGLSGGEGQG